MSPQLTNISHSISYENIISQCSLDSFLGYVNARESRKGSLHFIILETSWER